MAEKVICEKCGAEMVTIDPTRPVGMTCPSCGWGWVTSYYDPIEEDNTVYEIAISADNTANTENIKAISKISGLNYLDSRSAIVKAPTRIYSGIATEILSRIKFLQENGIIFEVTPNFPYLD